MSGPEFLLPIETPKVKVPQYLFPPGITIAETRTKNAVFPLEVDVTQFKPENIEQAAFMTKHAEISRSYLEANYPDFVSLPSEEEKNKLAKDYSVYFMLELVFYYVLYPKTEDSNTEHVWIDTLQATPEKLTFPAFLVNELAEILHKTHPLFSKLNDSEIKSGSSVQFAKDGQSLQVTLPPEAHKTHVNNTLKELFVTKLSVLDLAQLLNIYLHEDHKQAFVKTVPWLI